MDATFFGLVSESLAQSLHVDNNLNTSDIIAPFPVDGDVLNGYGPCLVVNETLRGGGFSPPKSTFPFRRLGWLNSNTSSFYFYHQINESTLAEEEHIDGAGWITRLIPVSTSMN